MVRKSIRVVLVAENDLPEVASDPGAEEPRRSSPRRLGRRRAVPEKQQRFFYTIYEGSNISHQLGDVTHVFYRLYQWERFLRVAYLFISNPEL